MIWKRLRPVFALVPVSIAAGGLSVSAAEVTWSPRPATPDAELTVLLQGSDQGATLHWGVNGQGHAWQRPPDAIVPKGSGYQGVAARTPFAGPDSNGVYRVALGPFLQGGSGVAGIDFAIQFDDGSWDNRNGQDYHIPLLPDRIAMSPARPGLGDPIRVTVRRSAPGGRLRWGINSEQGVWTAPHAVFRPPGSRVVGHGEAVETPLPDPDENGESVLTLGPFDQGHQFVRSLHAVVRWGDTWDNNFGSNYSVRVSASTEGGPQLKIYEPRSGAELRGDAEMFALSPQADELQLWLDGEPLKDIQGLVVRRALPVDDLEPGPHVLLARAAKGGRVSMDEVCFWTLPPELPPEVPAGPLRPGAEVHGDGTVTFALHAPGLRFVSLVGDFNDWDTDSDRMRLTEEGTWWIRRPVEDGEHSYRYVLEGDRRVADPYSVEVEWLDGEGREAADSELARSVLRVGAAPHAALPPFERPSPEQLIIYELHVQDFSAGGFKGVEKKLDYLRDLGVTAIEPLPVTSFPGDNSWGYNPAFHFAPESSYGSPEDLRRLVAAAHERGMAFIVDMVLNHLDRSSALWQLYRHDYDASPYFRFFDGPNWGFPDLDQRSATFRRYAADVLAHWLTEYGVDGFRYDATRWVEWEGFNEWGASWFAYAATRVDAGSYQVAEHIPSEPPLITETEMDMEWDAHFRWRLRDTLLHRRIEDPEELARILNPTPEPYASGFQRMVYIESHDESRFLAELLESGMGEDEALRRVKAALATLLTVPGVPMIYAGQEFGEVAPKVVGPNPLHWDRLEERRFKELHAYTRDLLRLRGRHAALAKDGLDLVINDAEHGVFAYQRMAGDEGVVTVVNVSGETRSVHLPPWPSSAYRKIGEAEVTLAGDAARVKLEAGGSVVLFTVAGGGP